MFSRRIRAARRPLCEAEQLAQFQNIGDCQECESDDVSHTEVMNGKYGSGSGSKMYESETFMRNARTSASKYKIANDGAIERLVQRADGMQEHRPVAISGRHQEGRPPSHPEGQNLKPMRKNNVRTFVEQQAQPWIDHETEMIQAELAAFWAQRAQAREEYRKSKALREAKAMESTPAARPAGKAQRGSSELAAAARARIQ